MSSVNVKSRPFEEKLNNKRNMQPSQHSESSQIYSSVCSFCLSINRSTTSVLQLSESWLNWAPFKIYSLSTQLCWECKARLKNHSEFCERAERAQQLLGQANTKDSLTEKSLSKLGISSTLLISIDTQIPDNDQFLPVAETIKNEADILKQEVETLADFETSNEYEHDYCEPEYSNNCDETVSALNISLENGDDLVGKNGGNSDNLEIDKCIKAVVKDTPNETKMKNRSSCISSGEKFSQDMKIDYKLYEKFTATEAEMREYLKPVSFICTHKCKVCLTEFKTIKSLMKHMTNLHSDCVGDHKCDVCGFGQPTETALQIHREQHYVFYRCLAEDCRFVHKFPPALKSHQTKHENTVNLGTYECRHCQKKFKKPSYVNKHIKQAHGDATKCKHCSKDFPDRKTLRQHMLLFHDDKMLVCDICSAKFTTLAKLGGHMYLHLNVSQKRYTCKICNRSFNCRFKERLHQFVHNGQPRIRCRICKTEFIEEESRIKHLETRHGIPREEATKELPSNRRHFDGRPYMCHICSDSFKNKLTLDNHVRKHSDVRAFKCEVCDKSFKYPGNMYAHKVLHTGKKAFVCDICNASFAHKSTLKGHIAIHTGIRPFKCNVCGKKFITNSRLKKHVRVH